MKPVAVIISNMTWNRMNIEEQHGMDGETNDFSFILSAHMRGERNSS